MSKLEGLTIFALVVFLIWIVGFAIFNRRTDEELEEMFDIKNPYRKNDETK